MTIGMQGERCDTQFGLVMPAWLHKEIKEAAGFTGMSDVLELLPGEHVIKIIGGTDSGTSLPVSDMSRWSYSIGGEWKMKFSVEPGHVYLLDLKVGSREKGGGSSAGTPGW